MKDQSGTRPLVIPVFIPHLGCPHQCIFCNQKVITNQNSDLPGSQEISNTIQTYLSYKGNRDSVELAFYGGNFLGLEKAVALRLLDAVLPYIENGSINTLRFSTRPDTVSNRTLAMIRDYPVSTIELGVQSMNDPVLKASNRGHTSLDTRNAVDLLRKNRYKVGIQLMIGLPRDNEDSLMKSTLEVAALNPDFIRIYPLLVMAGSPLEKLYQNGRYTPLSLDTGIDLAQKIVRIFYRQKIPVIRIGLQATQIMSDEKTVLAGPWHPAFGHLVFSRMMLDDVLTRFSTHPELKKSRLLNLRVHPKSESRLRGNKNSNLKELASILGHESIRIVKDETMELFEVKIGLENETH